MNIAQLIEMIDPEIYESLKSAVEVGKWTNGVALSDEQKDLCMQAIIAYDMEHKPPNERVGYISMSPISCADKNQPGEVAAGELRPVKLPGD